MRISLKIKNGVIKAVKLEKEVIIVRSITYNYRLLVQQQYHESWDLLLMWVGCPMGDNSNYSNYSNYWLSC